MDAGQARAIYEEIVRRKKDPALIELAGHGLLRARVFPISPGETRRITLRYTELMPRVGDALQFRYAAGGRYGVSRPVEAPGERPGKPSPRRSRSDSSPIPARCSATRFRPPISSAHGATTAG